MQGVRGWKLGIAGVVLMGLGLAPPRPAAALGPDDVGGGSLFVRRPDGGVAPLPLLQTDVELKVTGMLARTRLVQRFANPADVWVEGVYLFPLPEMAAVDHLDMRIGERVIEGQIRERAQARRSYEKARSQGRKASLVEQERPNLFTASLANIGPGDVVEIAIEYQETVRYRDGGFRLRLPLVAASRYVPGAGMEPSAAAGASPAVQPAAAVPDAARIAAALWNPDEGPHNRVRLRVELDAGLPLTSLVSPSHVVFAQELAAGGQRLYLEDLADRDFVLEWKPEPGSEPRVAVFAEPNGAGADVLLMVMPPETGQAALRLTREVVFVIDVSGSMGGASIRQARAALALALERLAPGDRFNVIRFNDRHQALFPTSVPADPANLVRARRWVERLDAGGGTEMLPALRRALAGDDGASDVRQVVFITDGSIANEAQLFAMLHTELGRSRLFPVGIGAAPNGYFLERAARFGRGSPTFVATPPEVETKMRELFARLESPVLADVQVLWNDHVEMWPERVPDLYLGEPVVVTARVPRFVGEVVVRGRRGRIPWEVRVPLAPGAPERGIGVLWARSKIAALMNSLATGAGGRAAAHGHAGPVAARAGRAAPGGRGPAARASAVTRRRAAALAALCGTALLIQGFWIPAKAVLAQALLERAWTRTRAGEVAVAPWPWADTWPVARLEVPGRGVRVLVLEGATGRTLAFGPGRLAGSAVPGAPGHSVVAGHRDTHFAFLRDLGPGDRIRVERADGARRSYRVTDLSVVHERDTRVLADTDVSTLSLVTCYPFDAALPGGPLRLVVRAEEEVAAAQPARRRSTRTERAMASVEAPTASATSSQGGAPNHKGQPSAASSPGTAKLSSSPT
jgi:Ca-activated chloride channel family protein